MNPKTHPLDDDPTIPLDSHAAARLRVSVKTVDSRLHRGICRLRDRLDGEYGGDRRAGIARVSVETLMLAIEDPVSKQRFYNAQVGASATTLSDGSFTLANVPKSATLAVTGKGLISEEPTPVPESAATLVVLRMARRCEFRVVLPAGLGRDAAFALCTAAGERLSMTRRTSGRLTYLLEAPIVDGQSEQLAAPDNAASLILLDENGDETRRMDVRLQAGRLNVIP